MPVARVMRFYGGSLETWVEMKKETPEQFGAFVGAMEGLKNAELADSLKMSTLAVEFGQRATKAEERDKQHGAFIRKLRELYAGAYPESDYMQRRLNDSI